MGEPLITAIVSTHAAERWIRGCLDDLLAQTIADRLEILVVDAGSPQGEAAIVHEYGRRHGNIRCVRTPTRENTSTVFNLATGLARGRYLTTANTDDRHHPDFCERMVAALEAHPQAGIAYADSLITTRDNETFADNTATRRYAWPDYTPTAALSCCLFGAQPVWRRDAHRLAGAWDPALSRANDHDMFLRIAWRCGAVHVREVLGLFLQRPDSQSGSDARRATLDEVLFVLRRHRAGIPLEDLFPALRACGDDPLARAAALVELGNLCALGPYTDAALALACWREAAALPLPGAAAGLVRTAFANNSACVLHRAGEPQQAARAFRLCAGSQAAARNLRVVAAAAETGVQPQLHDFTFVELQHPAVAQSRRTRGLVPAGGGRWQWSDEHEQVPWDVFAGPSGVPIAGPTGWLRPAPPRPQLRPAATPPAAGAGPRHVLLVMYGWADSGGGTMLPRAVARELARRGLRVSVFYASARPEPGRGDYALLRGSEDGAALYGLCNRPSLFLDLSAPGREVDDPRARSAFASLLDELRPDVVHFYNLHNLGMSLAAVVRSRGVPSVFSSNNYWALCPRLYLIDPRLARCTGGTADGGKCARCTGAPDVAAAAAGHARRGRAAREFLQHVDVHLATSQRVRDLHVAGGADPARIRVLLQQPPGSEEIWRRTGARRAVVARLDRPLRAAFVGSVMPHKGVHVLAAALQALPAGSVECTAFGDLQRDYLAELRRVDAGSRIGFHGAYRQEDLPELLAWADVVVVPSVWEDCGPLVVAEALAARAPVIGSRIGGIPDFLEEGRTGLLFAPGSAAELAGCLRAFLADRGLLGRMQRAIGPPRGLPAHVDDLLAVYAEVCAARAVVQGQSGAAALKTACPKRR